MVLSSIFLPFCNTKHYLNSFFVNADVPVPYQLSFQDPATEFVEGIIDLHHDVFGYLTFTCIFVFYMLGSTVFLFRSHNNVRPPVDIRHHTGIEIIWTILPTLVIVAIAIPSFILIYAMDELVGPQITIKAIGNQWYWDYEYTDMNMRQAGIPATRKLIDLNLYTNLARTQNATLFSFFDFFKPTNNWSLFLYETMDHFENVLVDNMLLLQFFDCLIHLQQRGFVFNSMLNDSFLEVFVFKLKQTIGAYLPFAEPTMFHILYDVQSTLFDTYSFFLQQNAAFLHDVILTGGFSSTFFSTFFSSFNTTKYFFFFQPLLNTNLISLDSISNDILSYYSLYSDVLSSPLFDTKLSLLSNIVLLNKTSNYNWVMSGSTENSIFYKYKYLTTFNDLLEKKEAFRFSSFWLIYSLYGTKRVPFSLKIESRMLDSDIVESSFGKKFRLLSVDRPVVMPVGTQIRFLTTANDVLHSWAVPSFGVKIDACPGRLNQVGIYIKREGVFYGQCSEICGVNHGFMPIEVRAYNSQDFLYWAAKNFPSQKFVQWSNI
jgi:heme/copper-type cytochrome/quinol oxidase subunit 2